MTAYLHPKLRYVPLVGVMSFISTTIVLFFFGPFDWPIGNHGLLALFLASALAAIAGGYTIGVTAPARRGELRHWRKIFVFGAVSSCVMVFPSAYVYTGKMPWEAIDLIFDQGQAYHDFQARILELDGQRGAVVVLRTLTQWAAYAVIPLAVLRWSQLTFIMRMLLAGSVLSAMSFSLLRGTDQGTFDLLFLFAASLCLATARHCMRNGISFGSLLRSNRGAMVMVVGVLLVAFAFNIFIERKVQRYEGNISDLCIGEERQICVNPRHPITEAMGLWGSFAFGMVSAYASQGYYGLALSLDRDFNSTLGIGHSTALTRIYETVTGDDRLYERSFTYRLRNDAWSDLYQWSSIYTWIANDVGFILTIPVVGVLAWLWGCSWRDAVGADNDAAGLVFCMLTQTFMYSPANFQLLLVTDTYAALLVWLAIWFYTAARQSG
jgi:hypothetical protein